MDAILVYGGMAFTVVLFLLMWMWFSKGGKHTAGASDGVSPPVAATSVDSRM